jgi:hypothetical protein
LPHDVKRLRESIPPVGVAFTNKAEACSLAVALVRSFNEFKSSTANLFAGGSKLLSRQRPHIVHFLHTSGEINTLSDEKGPKKQWK